MMATPNYNINYDDKRFQTVEAEKDAALSNVNNTYNNMISQSDKFYQDQIDAAKDYANTQQQIQQENTDFAIEKVEQQKAQANKDYTKEQAGAYVDWQNALSLNDLQDSQFAPIIQEIKKKQKLVAS